MAGGGLERRGVVVGLGATGLALLLVAGCGPVPGNPQPATYTDPPAVPVVTDPPRSDEADPAVRALGRLIAREDLTFHVVETVSTTGGGASATIELDVAGSDFSALMDIPGSKAIELRHVGGVTFARMGKGDWRAGLLEDKILDDLANPWLYLCWLDDLEYTGPATDPADGLVLACRKPYTYQTLTMRQEGNVGRIESLTLVLTPDGLPVRMELSGTGPTLATRSETFTATYVFSRVGERIVIKVPKR